MIGLTKEADGALRIVWLLGKTGRVTDAGTIAESVAVSPKFTLKILRQLLQGGVVRAERGKNGGYALAMEPCDITVRHIVEMIDGPISINRCQQEDFFCSRMGYDKRACRFHCLFAAVSDRLAQDLERVTLETMLSDGSCPSEILTPKK
jgi:Rrf2 family protein